MARTYTPERLDNMTLTPDELNKFNYYCFCEWGVNLNEVRDLYQIGLTTRNRIKRLNKRRYLRRKEKALAAKIAPPDSTSSTDSETKQALIATAQRVRQAMTPPTSPPKTPTFVDITPPDTPAPPVSYPPTPSPTPLDSYPPTPSPGVIPRIVPTGMDTSDYVTK